MSTDVLAPPLAAPSRRLLRRAAVLILLLLALAVGGTLAWRYWTVGRFLESTDDAFVGGDVTAIAPRVAGLIAQVPVVDNQRVRAGDLLVKLDDRDYRAAFARATASVAAAEAGLAHLDATTRLQEAMVDQARADISAAEAELTRARDDLDRYRRLSAGAAGTLQDFQRATADFRKADAAGAHARAVLDSAQRQFAVIDTQKLQARAALAQATAERDLAAINLADTEIRAPCDGVVGNRSARVGAYATVSAQLLALVPARGLWVDANFKESQLAAMRPGQPVRITADVLPGETLIGHVASLAPATGAQFSVLPAENATGNFTKIVQRVPVRIRLDEDAGTLGRLRPGLSVTASVDQRP